MMNPIIEARSSIYSVLASANAHHQVPGFLLGSFVLINKVHTVWRSYRQWNNDPLKQNLFTILNQKEAMSGFFEFAAKHSLRQIVKNAVGKFLPIRIFAQLLLISNSVKKSTEQFEKLSENYQQLKQAFWGKEILSVEELDLSVNHQVSIFSPRYILSPFYRLGIRIYEVTKYIFKVFGNLFVLSMRVIDAVDAFIFDPSTEDESLNILFSGEVGDSVDTLIENQKKLRNNLLKNQQFFEKIFSKTPFKFDSVIDTINSSISVIDTGHAGLKCVKKHVGTAITVAAVALGLSELAPKQNSNLKPLQAKPLLRG